MDFKKYYPELQARPSTLDTFVQCPLKSTLPADIDEFTSYIWKILHYSHQHPDWALGMINVFMVDYKEIVWENDNELRNMLLSYVEKGREFIEDIKQQNIELSKKKKPQINIAYEAPMSFRIEWVWLSIQPDISWKVDDNMAEVIDLKTSKSPWEYNKVLTELSKAQPLFYCYGACLNYWVTQCKFSYYVYGKGKKPKLHKHSRTLTVNELENECRKIIIQYKNSHQSWIFEARKCDHCFYCPIWPRKKQTCPLRQH